MHEMFENLAGLNRLVNNQAGKQGEAYRLLDSIISHFATLHDDELLSRLPIRGIGEVQIVNACKLDKWESVNVQFARETGVGGNGQARLC